MAADAYGTFNVGGGGGGTTDTNATTVTYTDSNGQTVTVKVTSTVLCQSTNYPQNLGVVTVTQTALACTFPSTTTTTATYTGTDSGVSTTTLTLTRTVVCQTTNYPGNLAVVTATQTQIACTYTTSTSTTTSYSGQLNVDRTSASVGQNFHFSGYVLNNGQSAGGVVLYLMSGSSVIGATNANPNGTFDFYQSFGQAGTYSVFVKLPDGKSTNSVSVTVSAYQSPPTLTASSASLLSNPKVYWSVIGFSPSSQVTLTVKNSGSGSTFTPQTVPTSSSGSASGYFTATTAMVGTDQLTATDSKSVTASTYFTVGPGYTYPQSVLGISGSVGSLPYELVLSFIVVAAAWALIIKGKDEA